MADETKLSHAGRRACNPRTPLQPPSAWARTTPGQNRIKDGSTRSHRAPTRSQYSTTRQRKFTFTRERGTRRPTLGRAPPPAKRSRACLRSAQTPLASAQRPSHARPRQNARTHELKRPLASAQNGPLTSLVKRPFRSAQTSAYASSGPIARIGSNALHLPQTSAQIGSNASPRRRIRPPSCRYVSATFTSRADNPLASMRLSALQRPRRPIARSTREWISPH